MNTNVVEFRFDLFEHELTDILSNCQYITLPFDLPIIGPELNRLLSECAETFFLGNVNKDSLQNALSTSKIILDFSWEKINTGHWKDVDKIWRDLYTFASIFKVLCLLALKTADKLDIIKECDKGLLLGAPLMGNILSKIAFKLSEMKLKETSLPSKEQEIKCKKRKTSIGTENISLEFMIREAKDVQKDEFINHYMKLSIPVILTEAIADWPAISSRPWNIDYILSKSCFRTVPIEIGSKYTDENWTQKLMTVEDFVKQYIWNRSEEIGYLAQHNLFIQIPELKEDIIIPFYIDEDAFVDISIWFGPSGTISPLHYDPKHNLLAQVMGEKYIRLYSKEQSPYLYAKEDPLFYNTSQVDVENPDLESFPLFSKAEYSECILKPGNLLYIPPKCWHYVRSLSTSISISFWW